MSRAPIDLGYTHEMVSIATVAVPARGPHRIAGSGLTARLSCLKALADAERNERLSFCTRMAMHAAASRRRAN